MNGVEIIRIERERGIVQEGWTAEHDDDQFHARGELARAAACYALEPFQEFPAGMTCRRDLWPKNWDAKWWKPCRDDRIKELAKAGALLAAEIDRLTRIKETAEILSLTPDRDPLETPE